MDSIPDYPKLKIDNYLSLLMSENEGEGGNDFVRLYGIRNYLRSIINEKYSRKDLSKLLNVRVKSINNWIGNSQRDVGIPIKYAIKIAKISGRNKDELFEHVDYFGCMNSKKYRLPKFISPKLSYLLGSMIGDGHLANPEDFISNGSRYNAEIKITDGSRNQLVFLRDIFKDIFDYSPPMFTEGNYYRLIGRSKPIHMFLSKVCGVPTGMKKSKTCVPKIIDGHQEFERWFLSGLFDSDGCCKGRKISIKQHNRELLERCTDILKNNDVNASGIYADRGIRNGVPTLNHVLVVGKRKEINRFISVFYSNKIRGDY